MRTALAGTVVPFFAQSSAQSNSASDTLVLCFCSSAALQQSMSMPPPMLQLLSPKFSGTPATAPPRSTSKRNKDTSRNFIARLTVRSKFITCQESRSPFDRAALGRNQ